MLRRETREKTLLYFLEEHGLQMKFLRTQRHNGASATAGRQTQKHPIVVQSSPVSYCEEPTHSIQTSPTSSISRLLTQQIYLQVLYMSCQSSLLYLHTAYYVEHSATLIFKKSRSLFPFCDYQPISGEFPFCDGHSVIPLIVVGGSSSGGGMFWCRGLRCMM